MTVAVAVKVFDGVILAADSATTLALANGSHHVWNNASKVFHLHRRLPVGAMTWGLGTIGSASIATLMKDLRRRLMGKDPSHPGWALEEGEYTVEEVAERLVEMIFDELFAPQFAGSPPPSGVGFVVAGYSAGMQKSEIWNVWMEDPSARPAIQLVGDQDISGWLTRAQVEATHRLFNGLDPCAEALIRPLVDPAKTSDFDAVIGMLRREPVVASMPLADAVNLARYLVDVTIGYSNVLLGPNTVGGAIEVAAISRHEGFRWIARKHYYPPELNPKESPHDDE